MYHYSNSAEHMIHNPYSNSSFQKKKTNNDQLKKHTIGRLLIWKNKINVNNKRIVQIDTNAWSIFTYESCAVYVP